MILFLKCVGHSCNSPLSLPLKTKMRKPRVLFSLGRRRNTKLETPCQKEHHILIDDDDKGHPGSISRACLNQLLHSMWTCHICTVPPPPTFRMKTNHNYWPHYATLCNQECTVIGWTTWLMPLSIICLLYSSAAQNGDLWPVLFHRTLTNFQERMKQYY